MTITGSSQGARVVLSIVRVKVLALLVGPAGVGVLSIYNSVQSTASTVAGLGIGVSAVQQIARARDDEIKLARVRRVLFTANVVQGAIAAMAIWLLRAPLARWLFSRPGYETPTGLVGIAVFLALLAASQTALLRGLRRIGDLGRTTVLSALICTVVGVAAVWSFGMTGLILLVLIEALTTVIVAAWYVRKLPRSAPGPIDAGQIWRIWTPMLRVGMGFMLSGLATTGTLLLVRGRIASELGIDAAGQFAAAWSMTGTYAGFLLSAIAMDYYPRLAEVIDDRDAATRLINEQMQLGLVVGGPVILLLIGLAPVAVVLLYSHRFGEAGNILQWQAAGDVFKLASWSLSYSIIAAARPKAFMLLEATFLIPYGSLIYFLLPSVGLEITGTAFLGCYVIYFSTAYLISARTIGFRIEALSLKLLAMYGASAFALLALALTFPRTGAAAAVVLSLFCGVISGHVVLEKIGPHPYAAALVRIYSICGWPIRNQL